MSSRNRSVAGLALGALVVSGLTALGTAAQATPEDDAPVSPAAVVTDPNDGVPRADPPPVYENYQSILDPGATAAGYFQPFWFDTQGRHIQAHGGQIVTVQENGEDVYYWYGEDRTNGYFGSPGVSVYRSTDTLNWENLGTALRGISDPAELTTDPYFVDLYDTLAEDGSPRTDLVNSLSYHLNTTQSYDYSAIFERPKVLYNATTDQWVMWWHADGRTSANGSMYARSLAAVAVADNPEGPFRMTGAYRMPNRANYQACTTSAVPGQARDMTVFQDADGQAYISYSSEENYTLYVTRLNDSYTNVENTTSVDAVRTGSYGGAGSYMNQYSEDGQYPYIFADGAAGAPVQGEDFQIVKECGHLEAPAIFTHGSKYYVIASGATGWAPNQQSYHSADSLFGTWIRGVTPNDAYENVRYDAIPEGGDGRLSIGDNRRTTFGSQSTNVLTLSPGRYIYMGDRWNSGASDSTYVWLPITVGEGGALEMRNPAVEDPQRYAEGWDASYWDDKGAGEGIWTVVDTDIPSAVQRGSDPAQVLPATVEVDVNGTTAEVAVAWEASFANLGRHTVTGTLAAGDGFTAGRTFTRTVDVYAYGTVNLAPSATVTASSRADLAPLVIDGNLTTKGWDDWASGGTHPRNSWLAFVWPTAQRPDTVIVNTYQDGAASWPSTVRVQHRDSAGAWVDSGINVALDPAAATAPVATLDVTGVPATTGIRVQLQTQANIWQAISEVQILGTPAAEGNLCRIAGSRVSASFHQTEWSVLPAANACDGNTATTWSTWAGGGLYPATPSFSVRAGTPYDVSQVTFTNTEGSPSGVSVDYRDTTGQWHTTAVQNAPVAAHGTPTVLNFDKVSALEVRLTFTTPGTFVKISEITIPALLSPVPEVPVEGPTTSTTVTPRCLAGKVYLYTSVQNTDDEAVALTVTTPLGVKSYPAVEPGRSVTFATNSRLAALPGGTVTVDATASGTSSQEVVTFAATTCS